jgi:hypothetical protein
MKNKRRMSQLTVSEPWAYARGKSGLKGNFFVIPYHSLFWKLLFGDITWRSPSFSVAIWRTSPHIAGYYKRVRKGEEMDHSTKLRGVTACRMLSPSGVFEFYPPLLHNTACVLKSISSPISLTTDPFSPTISRSWLSVHKLHIFRVSDKWTFLNTLRTGLLNCLNARSLGLTFRHRAFCI